MQCGELESGVENNILEEGGGIKKLGGLWTLMDVYKTLGEEEGL